MSNDFEEITRETMSKLRDYAMNIGIRTGLRIIKTIIDQENKNTEEKYDEITKFIEKVLENDPFMDSNN